jgi:ribosome maturation factor RimP
VGTAEAVERVVAPALEVLGLELLDVESRPGLVRVTIDREDGLDLESISKATHALSAALDEADCVPGGRYELEVSSPGVERRLRRPEHYAKVLGTEVAVRLKPGIDADRRLEGQLRQADTGGIELQVEGEDATRRISYADIERCHTVFDWRAALAADSAARPKEEDRRASRPSAAERSRAAAAARAGTKKQPGDSSPVDDLDTTEIE